MVTTLTNKLISHVRHRAQKSHTDRLKLYESQMKKKILCVASLIFGALLGIWLSGAITNPITRANGQITEDIIEIHKSITNNTLTQSTIISFPNGKHIEVSGTWATNILIFILPCLFLWAALASQKTTQNLEKPKRTTTAVIVFFAASLSIMAVLLSEYKRLIHYLAQSKNTAEHEPSGIFELANIFVTSEALFGGLFLFLVSGILPILAACNNRTQRSQNISAAWWLLTVLLITYGLFTSTSIPST